MAGLNQFNPEKVAQLIAQGMQERMADGGEMSPEDINENTGYLQEFAKIAGGIIQGEPNIEIPGTNQAIPFDESSATKAMHLFSEGIYHALIKCHDLGITGQLKVEFLQPLAMEVFNQTKQIIATIHGQEHTPEFQFSDDQLINILHQTAESVLMAYINEYEREHGPIIPEEIMNEATASEALLQQTGTPPSGLETAPTTPPGVATSAISPSAPIVPATPSHASSPSQKVATQHDKYAAVALLLNTLPADQRKTILRNFNAEEKELIMFYSYPENIEKNLDLTCVESHLRQFKQLAQQGSANLKSPAYRAIEKLTQSYSKEKLLSCVQKERALVQKYVAAFFDGDDTESWSMDQKQGRHFREMLSPKIEEILHQYLLQSLNNKESYAG